jgi:TonB-linked SusC/RagA family outer membrane protein
MLRKLLLLMSFIVPLSAAMGQTTTVRGVISSADGEPLPGVSVEEKGLKNGIYSNLEGRYELLVQQGATLVFRMEGMKTQEQAVTGPELNVTMEEEDVVLDDVIITALGIPSDERKVGYSIAKIDGNAVRAAGETNSIAGMAGKVTGVQVINSSGAPGASAFIRIRGSRSLNGENQPLLVVDGVPMDNSQNVSGNPDDGNNALLEGAAQSNRGIDINPDDIESVTVLKGPNAAALYGIAAANGAIVITTKRGKPTMGRAVNVTYNGSMSIDQVNRLPKLQNRFTQGDEGTYYGPDTYLSLSWGALADTMSWNGDGTYTWDKNGDLVGSSDPTATTKFVPYDNLGTFFQNGTTWNHNLSLSGGNNLATYRLSIGQTNQNGVVPNSDFSRSSVRFNSDANISTRLRAGVSLNYTHSGGLRVQQGSNTSGLMLGLLRTPISFDNSNGNEDPVNDPTSYILPDGTQRNYRGGFGYDNPYWAVNKSPFNDDVNRFFGAANVSYDPFKWLNISYRLGTDAYTDNRTQIFDINSRTAPAGRMYKMSHIRRHINSDLFVTASHNFNENFGGSLLIGHNMYDQHYNRMYTQGDGFIMPNFYNIANATSVLAREYNSRYRKAAVFANAKLFYKNYLFLDLTARNEWSSTLPASKNRFLYPSASLGFVFTEALGMTDNKVLPFGKLRVSYAQVGQDAAVYSLSNYFSSSFIGDGWTNGISFPIAGMAGFMSNDQLGNPNLKPEKTNSFEIGTDLRFLSGRLGLDFTYYNTASVDQILPVPVAASSGWLTYVMNSGKVTNKGIEVMIDATPIKTKNFRWDVTLNYTRNRNMVVALADGVESLFLGGFEGSSVRNVPGQAYGTLYGLTWLRDDAGNIVIESDTGSANYGFPIASLTEDVIGDPNPDFLAGLRNTLTWKGFSFSFLFDYRKGGDIWNGTQGALTFFGMSDITENRGETHVFEGVMGTVDGDGNLISSGQTNTTEVVLDEAWYTGDGGGFGNVSENFVQDGSFLKLRDISLGWEIPTKVLAKTPIASASVGVSGRNFLLWSPYQGIDPETNLMGSMNAQGLDYFNMPSTRSYLFNVSLGF